eukprot:scaffold13360_cov204-Alexandrium_tamarense.AAC.15
MSEGGHSHASLHHINRRGNAVANCCTGAPRDEVAIVNTGSCRCCGDGGSIRRDCGSDDGEKRETEAFGMHGEQSDVRGVSRFANVWLIEGLVVRGVRRDGGGCCRMTFGVPRPVLLPLTKRKHTNVPARI